jgi:hypothetical protein
LFYLGGIKIVVRVSADADKADDDMEAQGFFNMFTKSNSKLEFENRLIDINYFITKFNVLLEVVVEDDH